MTDLLFCNNFNPIKTESAILSLYFGRDKMYLPNANDIGEVANAFNTVSSKVRVDIRTKGKLIYETYAINVLNFVISERVTQALKYFGDVNKFLEWYRGSFLRRITDQLFLYEQDLLMKLSLSASSMDIRNKLFKLRLDYQGIHYTTNKQLAIPGYIGNVTHGFDTTLILILERHGTLYKNYTALSKTL